MQLGNLKRFETAVPSQDKNKPFLTQTLADVATLPKPYDFTFPEIMGKARTIDVTWFNERHFPQAFYEVEHSTDIYNSLRKFVEFQDFRVKMWIVADKAREAEFENKRNATAFKSVADTVQFLSYEQLSKLHASAVELAIQEERLS